MEKVMCDMEIVSVIKDAFQEYEGEHSLVLFSRGCNYNCPTCHNRNFINNKPIGTAIELINELITPIHTAVVFLGGEPTIHGEKLIEAIKHAKGLGLKTKVFTNGSWYGFMKELIMIVDSISIDLKALHDTTVEKITGIYQEEYADCIITLAREARLHEVNIELRTTNLSVLPNKELERIKIIIPDGIKHIIQREIQ
ncbi:MAG: pyruvate formate lyase activating enzyme [Candidatus Magnetoglobus multicellularis str. Araruama]|uniref:Pyruvate formate lyase activating enzyme n=1 Tax=Candidatus Magnetoglobus multicellularis str. Araruama TaxID=890399 RepID=A0A1V1P4N0_9BACT|nr:MAG: pyruvate formate lyase activating enzyme [Candidatus Magnetoglobus multicellularis str. Araruama]